MITRFRQLLRSVRGVAATEFALGLPLFLGFTLSGLEMANYILVNHAMQRLATTSADMLSQAGLNGEPMTEADIYDIFRSADSTGSSVDMASHGRLILTVVKGSSAGGAHNEFADSHAFSQQFDGGLVSAVPLLGCHDTVAQPTYDRNLPAGELMAHAQATYAYQPLFSQAVVSFFNVPALVTRTAVFRMRKNSFNINNDGTHPSKNDCDTADGL